ncbi:MAG: SPOR domain-containing protein [Candidatus Kapaibacterium sp.]
MSQTTERTEQQRFRMERLATGGTSSAMTRDAARLRSVMGQAVERPNEERQIHSVAGDAVMPPLPDLDAPIAAMVVSAAEPDARPEYQSPTKSATPTGLRPIAPAAVKSQTAQTASDGATRMRSVAALGATASVATAPKEEVAAPVATAPKEEKKATERPRSASRMMLEPSPAGNISRSNFRPAAPRATESPVAESRPTEPAPQPQREPVTSYGKYRDTPTVAFEPMAYSSPVVSARPRGRMWAIALTVVLGTGLGVGLYAGGGDLISSIFANRNEGVATDNPSAVTERPQAAQPPPQQALAPAASAVPSQMAGETVGSAEAVQGTTAPPATTDVPPQQATGGATTADHNDITTGSRPAAEPHDLAAANDIRPGNEPKPAKNQEEKKKKPAESEAAREKGSEKDLVKPSPSKFMVQVRATPDEAEANLLAKKLRSKGMGAISVVKSEKDGTKLYRVRFGSFASQSEAQSAATRAGYASVWVIKQK